MDVSIKQKIKELVISITPYDSLEGDHIKDVSDWIESGVDIFRIKKDALPPKHLVSYSVVLDLSQEKVLLFDHKKSTLMLPSGGHIDINELPMIAAKRELKEELGLSLEPYVIGEQGPETPFFVTVTKTVGINEPHTDVSLWYVFIKDATKPFKSNGDEFDKEFDGFHWLYFDEVLSSDISKFDPHMHRFIHKIKKFNNG